MRHYANGDEVSNFSAEELCTEAQDSSVADCHQNKRSLLSIFPSLRNERRTLILNPFLPNELSSKLLTACMLHAARLLLY